MQTKTQKLASSQIPGVKSEDRFGVQIPMGSKRDRNIPILGGCDTRKPWILIM